MSSNELEDIDVSADTVTGEAPVSRLYTMTSSTTAIVSKLSELDAKGLGDVVRAAVWLMKSASEDERKRAYEQTRVTKKKLGRPVARE